MSSNYDDWEHCDPAEVEKNSLQSILSEGEKIVTEYGTFSCRVMHPCEEGMVPQEALLVDVMIKDMEVGTTRIGYFPYNRTLSQIGYWAVEVTKFRDATPPQDET